MAVLPGDDSTAVSVRVRGLADGRGADGRGADGAARRAVPSAC